MIRLNRTSDTLDVSYVNTSVLSLSQLELQTILNEGKELIYWSEKNGWGQFLRIR